MGKLAPLAENANTRNTARLTLGVTHNHSVRFASVGSLKGGAVHCLQRVCSKLKSIKLSGTFMQSGLELYDPKHQYRADKAQRKQDFNNCCAYCGIAPSFLTIDHVFPRSQGGTNDPSNLLPACKSCNESKGSRSLSNWYTPRNRRYTSERWEKIKSILGIE